MLSVKQGGIKYNLVWLDQGLDLGFRGQTIMPMSGNLTHNRWKKERNILKKQYQEYTHLHKLNNPMKGKHKKLITWFNNISYTSVVISRCPWCNGYRHRKWTRWHEFKSWTRLIAFHIALMPLGKVWIQSLSLQLWVNSRTDYVLQARRGKTLNSNLLNIA